MSLTATTFRTTSPRLKLSGGTIVEGEEERTDNITALEYGIYRATKNRRLVDECVGTVSYTHLRAHET